jgi:hypothetical protein
MFAISITGCHGREIIAIERNQLQWKVTSLFENSMVAIKTKLWLCKSVFAMESHWLLLEVTGCYGNVLLLWKINGCFCVIGKCAKSLVAMSSSVWGQFWTTLNNYSSYATWPKLLKLCRDVSCMKLYQSCSRIT